MTTPIVIMQYQVPQFIEVEDRIIGPLTIRQFFMLLAPGGIIFLLWFFLEFFLWLGVAIVLAGLGAGMAFLKIGEQPFYQIVLAFFGYAVKPHLYLWKQLPVKAAPPKKTAETAAAGEGVLNKLAGKINIFHS